MVATRANFKVLASIGLKANDYYAHHKNHIWKEMYILFKAYILTDNEISGIGKAIIVACVRVVVMKNQRIIITSGFI